MKFSRAKLDVIVERYENLVREMERFRIDIGPDSGKIVTLILMMIPIYTVIKPTLKLCSVLDEVQNICTTVFSVVIFLTC